MSAGLAKRSIRLDGHATSLALEPEFWAALDKLATQQQRPLSHLVAAIDRERAGRNLASALRVYVLGQTTGYATHRTGA